MIQIAGSGQRSRIEVALSGRENERIALLTPGAAVSATLILEGDHPVAVSPKTPASEQHQVARVPLRHEAAQAGHVRSGVLKTLEGCPGAVRSRREPPMRRHQHGPIAAADGDYRDPRMIRQPLEKAWESPVNVVRKVGLP